MVLEVFKAQKLRILIYFTLFLPSFNKHIYNYVRHSENQG